MPQLAKKIPLDIGTQYRVRVNNKTIVLPIRIVSGKRILIAAGFDPDTWLLLAHYPICGHIPERILDNQIVDLAQGVLRFTALPLIPPC